MSSYIRPRIPGACIFFTVALAQRGDTLLVDEVDSLRLAVARTKAERPFFINAWVTLPDHLHAVWTLPDGDADYATRWKVIKARFSCGLPDIGLKRASHLKRRERGIWQRRFWEHHIRGPQDYAGCMEHCITSPVRQGLVNTAEAWPYSSIHRDKRAIRKAA